MCTFYIFTLHELLLSILINPLPIYFKQINTFFLKKMLPVNSRDLKDNSQGGVEEDGRAERVFSPTEFAMRGKLRRDSLCLINLLFLKWHLRVSKGWTEKDISVSQAQGTAWFGDILQPSPCCIYNKTESRGTKLTHSQATSPRVPVKP